MKRDDLQGLRGLAILAVISFHFFPKQFPNGYIGVDIFFVLSGFLMTMIFGSKPINQKSIKQFYTKRIKRILPLYVLLIFVGSCLVFLLFPKTFVSMNMDSAWKAIFLYHNMAHHSDANLYFKMLNQADDLFTHTWSLCVEMQFYLLVPIIFSIFKHFDMLLTLPLLLISSLSAHLLVNDETSFNNVFCRVWQFLVGSIAFYLSEWLNDLDKRKIGGYEKLMTYIEMEERQGEGEEEEEEIPEERSVQRMNLNRAPFYIALLASLIILGFLSFSPFPVQPSILRITTTLMTMLVIVCGSITVFNPLSNRLLVYIGDISYSLYLIHWPVYVYLKFCYSNDPQIYILGISLSILLSIAILESYEKFYLSLSMSKITVLLAVFYTTIILLVTLHAPIDKLVEKAKFGDEKLKNTFENITLKEAIVMNKNWARNEYDYLIIPNCYPNRTEHGYCEFDRSGLTGNMRTMIIGNSYTANLGDLVYKSFRGRSSFMAKLSYSYCEVLTVDVNRCTSIKNIYLNTVTKVSPDYLFLISRHIHFIKPISNTVETDPIYLEALATLQQYENLKSIKKIYILNSITPPKSITLSKFADLLEKGKTVEQSLFKVDLSYQNGNRRLEKLVEKCEKCEIIDVSSILYNGKETKSFDEKTKLGYYYDGLHLTPFAKQLILPVFEKLSKRL